MTREELIEQLCSDFGYNAEKYEDMDSRDLVNEWAEWEGLLGYTDQIIDVVFAAYEPIVLPMAFNDIEEDEQPYKLAELFGEMDEEQKKTFLELIK